MNQSINDTDTYLRALENQALPDLSQMDTNWQAMKTALADPATNPPATKRPFLLRLLAGGGIIAGLIVVLLQLLPAKKDTQAVNDKAAITVTAIKKDTIPGSAAPVTKDSAQIHYLKAKLSDGKDTVLGFTYVNTNNNRNENTAGNNASLNGFFQSFEKPAQLFLVNPQRDTVVEGAEGTVLRIKAGSFNSNQTITLRLKEFYTYSDMILHRLSTTSGGKQLISGGMIHLEAQDENGPVSLKTGQTLGLEMPGQADAPAMELFYGESNSKTDTIQPVQKINWQPTNRTFKRTRTMNKLANFRSEKRMRAMPAEFGIVAGDSSPRVIRPLADTLISGEVNFLDADSMIATRYGVEISQLGWINCDRFYGQGPKVDFTVIMPGKASDYSVLLVFEQMKSLMIGEPAGDRMVFAGVPEGAAAKLISVGMKEGKPVSAMATVQLSRAPFSQLQFEATTPDAFREEVKLMDK